MLNAAATYESLADGAEGRTPAEAARMRDSAGGRPELSAPPAWLLVEPPDSVASGKAQFVNALHCFLARQWGLVSVVRQVGAVPFHNLVKLSAKAFI